MVKKTPGAAPRPPAPLTPGQVRGVPEGCSRADVWPSATLANSALTLNCFTECLPLFSAQGVPAAWIFVHDGGAAKLSSGTGLHSSLAKSLFGSTSPEEGGEKCRRLRGHKRLRR